MTRRYDLAALGLAPVFMLRASRRDEPPVSALGAAVLVALFGPGFLLYGRSIWAAGWWAVAGLGALAVGAVAWGVWHGARR